MEQEPVSKKPSEDLKPTNQNEKPKENERVGSFEELLKLDPKKVKSFKVEPKK